jgi:nicotinate-nucleotide adenylyltransferase
MRRGFLGGTFDPIHFGHLDVAAAAQRALALDQVAVIPAGLPPHRRPPVAPAADRLAMARLATEGRPGLTVSDLETRTDGPSFTSATLDRLVAEGLDTRTVFFITGADAFREIATWKDYPGLLDRCHFVAVSRPGCSAQSLPGALPELAGRMLDAPCHPPARPSIFLVDAVTAPVSSTEVRRRVAAGESLDGLVPDAVARYIRSHGLYA